MSDTVAVRTITPEMIEDELVNRCQVVVEVINDMDDAGFYFTHMTGFKLWGASRESVERWTTILYGRGLLKKKRGYVLSKTRQTDYFFTADRDRSGHIGLEPDDEHKKRWAIDTVPLWRNFIDADLKTQLVYDVIKESTEKGECINPRQIAGILTDLSADYIRVIATKLLNDRQIYGVEYRASNGRTALAYSTTGEELEMSTVRTPAQQARESEKPIFNLFNTLPMPSDAARPQ